MLHTSQTSRTKAAKQPARGHLISSARFGVALATAATSFAALVFSTPVFAGEGLQLRVEARPIEQPIRVWVTVRNPDGEPVLDLADDQFEFDLPAGVQPEFDFTLPGNNGDPMGTSVALVMDYSATIRDFQDEVEQASEDFIDQMQPEDFAAVIKFNQTQGINALQPFTQTDAAGKDALIAQIYTPYEGGGTPFFGALEFALNKFTTTETDLPLGPKAVVALADGDNNVAPLSGAGAVELASQQGIPIFTIGLGNVNDNPDWLNNLTLLANNTGGSYFDATTDPETQVAEAYQAATDLLNNAYLFKFDSTITDCNPHTITVRVGDLEEEATFTRRACDPPRQSSSGGGGALGPFALVAGLSLLALRRRLFSA